MNFSDALDHLKGGEKVTREGWNGKRMFLLFINPYHNNQYHVTEKHETIVGTLMPYIAMKTADNGLVPWLASHTDLLAEDWHVFK